MKRYKIITPKGEVLDECEEVDSHYVKTVQHDFFCPTSWMKLIGLRLEEIVPEKRKLKAMKFGDGQIRFYPEDCFMIQYKGLPPVAAPEFDIEFGGENG